MPAGGGNGTSPAGHNPNDANERKYVIKLLQELGFTLREAKELINTRTVASVSNNPAELRGVPRMIALTKKKLQLIEKKSRLVPGELIPRQAVDAM
jgi:DNA-binding transcriptional MerR regulator